MNHSHTNTDPGAGINPQSAGPIITQRLDGSHVFNWRLTGADGFGEIASVCAWPDHAVGAITQRQADGNARTLAAGFNLLDKTGRALNVDAATLGEGLDLVGLIRAARAALPLLEAQDRKLAAQFGPGQNEPLTALRAALSTLPALP